MKKRLLISFSGGRTSAFMLWYLTHVWEDRSQYDIVVVFANTGKEVEGTLLFVDECAQEWGIDIIWVEGYPSAKGKGWKVFHKVVDYKTASRNGEPFEAMCAKLGIPSTNAPFCSDQLKRKAIESYLQSIGWVNGSYDIAIGYRVDEPKRWRKKNGQRKIKKNRILPLVDIFPVDKPYIIEWFSDKSFNLDIHEDDGNCDNCWKKDLPRLCRNAIRKPKSFDWWASVSDKYGMLNPRDSELKPPFNFYRGNMHPREIVALAKKVSQEQIKQLSLYDEQYSCNESCEAF
jgi:hypothetical protein